MNKIFVIVAAILLAIMHINANASSIIFVSDAPHDFWVCKATDLTQRTWTQGNEYQRRALLDALDACKKESTVPNTCKAVGTQCDGILSGSINRAVWRCTSLDTLANYWYSNISPTEIEAALSARDICRKESSVPLTCYINMLTCENLNKNFINLND